MHCEGRYEASLEAVNTNSEEPWLVHCGNETSFVDTCGDEDEIELAPLTLTDNSGWLIFIHVTYPGSERL